MIPWPHGSHGSKRHCFCMNIWQILVTLKANASVDVEANTSQDWCLFGRHLMRNVQEVSSHTKRRWEDGILIPKNRTDSGTNHVRRSWSLLSWFCHCRCRCRFCRRCDCRRPSRSHPSFSSSCSSSYCSCSANVFFLKLKEHRGYPICSSPLCQCDVDPTAEVTFFPRFVALVHGHGESTRYAIPGALAAFSKG